MSAMTRRTANVSTISTISTLTLVFILLLVLKLGEVGNIAHWSWWWVTSPLWILPLCGVVFVVTISLFGGLLAALGGHQRKS